jgi:GTP-binding protein
LLIDSRRGITSIDADFMNLMEDLGVNFQVVFTKVDSVSGKVLEDAVKSAEVKITEYMHMNPVVHLVSSKENIGIPQLRGTIVERTGLLQSLVTKADKRRVREYEEQLKNASKP